MARPRARRPAPPRPLSPTAVARIAAKRAELVSRLMRLQEILQRKWAERNARLAASPPET